jgi:Uma2 family endonuclease
MAMPVPVESMSYTADDLLRVRFPDKSTELVRGSLVVREPPSTEHGRIQANLAYFVTEHVRKERLGFVFGQDTGFKIHSEPDTVRAADVAYVRHDRAPEIPKRGYASLAPDLVAEILSPEDRPGEYLAKVAQWLDAGTVLVWVVDPQRAQAHVHRADGSLTIVREDGTLEGEAVLPGFSCPLAEVLR